MTIKTLGISTSPRILGNSDLLLREALSGAESAGSHTEYTQCQIITSHLALSVMPVTQEGSARFRMTSTSFYKKCLMPTGLYSLRLYFL